MAQKNIIIICGEASGDLHAGALAEALKKLDPDINIGGVGGTCLAQSGAEILRDIKDLACLGLFDVLKKLPLFFALKKTLLQKIAQNRPDAIILVDFSGFNLRLAKAINKKIPVIYYVSPQVWASRPGRIKAIRKYVHKMVVLFRFEEEFYKSRGIEAAFAGHPLLDSAACLADRAAFLAKMNLDPAKKIFALLPGSRPQEIKHILPVMIKTAVLLRKNISGAQFIIAKSPQVDLELYNRIICQHKIDFRLGMIEGKTCACLGAADFALVASGTATLEAAIIGTPFVVVYKMDLLNYLLYRPLVKVSYICIASIISQKKIVPEFIQFRADPARIAREVSALIADRGKLEQMQADLSMVKSLLGEPGASERAARLILDFLNNK